MSRYRTSRRFLLLLLVAVLVAGMGLTEVGVAPIHAQTPHAQKSEHHDQVLNYLKRVRHETEAPGISAAVAVDGEIVFSEGVGYAELDNMTPQTSETVHNIGSISKVNAVVGLMQLVEEGKVDLDATLQTYLPYMPEKRWDVTVRHILTHTSGIRHYREDDFGPRGLQEMRHYDDFSEATKIFRGDSLMFEPGTYYSYSSYATNLMHGIVESVTDEGFEEYLKRHVWEPAGMLSTQFDVPSRIVHNRGQGYERDSLGYRVEAPYVDVSYKYAGGGMISTVDDLVRLGMALNTGSILRPETVQTMYEPQLDPSVLEYKQYNPDEEPEKRDWKQGLIWYWSQDGLGRWWVGHTGSVRGTRSALMNYPDRRVVVAIQANIRPFDADKHAQAIAQMFLSPKYEAPSVQAIKEAIGN